MKNFLLSLLLLVPLTLFAQPTPSPIMRRTNDTAYGATLLGNTRIGDGLVSTNPLVLGTFTMWQGATSTNFQMTPIGVLDSFGPGANFWSFGLSLMKVQTNLVTITPSVVFEGNAELGAGASILSGSANLAIGIGSTLDGNRNVGLGIGHTLTGDGNAAFGSGHTVIGDGNFVVGTGLTVTGNDTIHLGNPVRLHDTLVVDGVITGNGGGLTNLQVASGDTFIVKGKATFTNNVFLTTTSYSTNSAASETTIDLAQSYRAFATNNNTAFSALAGIEAARTNIQTVNIFITNSSAAAKTITMDAQFQNMNASEGNTLYVTNVGHLLVFYYPGFGTNFYFKSR